MCRFLNNGTAGVAGAVLRITDGDGVLEACEVDGAAGTNQSIAVDGASASLAIRDSLITGILQSGQDAVFATNGAAMTLERTRISGNAASRLFVRATSNASMVMQSCILDDNTLSVERLIGAAGGGTVDIFNSTLTGNTMPTEIFAPSPNIRAFNSIIFGNAVDSTLFPGGPVLYRCIYPGATGDNLNVTPMFLDGPNGDYRLAAGSAAIDAGDSRFPILEAYGATDFAGNDRLGDALAVADTGFADGTLVVDIGAYEAPYDLPAVPPACPTDLNGDGVVDGADLGLLLGAWGPCS
jgi:hypothetical protein